MAGAWRPVVNAASSARQLARGASVPRRRLRRSPEHVPDAANGVDEPWRARVVLDLAAEPVDVDVDGPRLAGVVVAPDPLEQLVASEDLARVADEEREQVERLRLDRQRLAVPQEAVAGEVDLDPLEIDDRRRRLDRDSLFGAAEEGPDPGRQLAQAEWLRDVVVGAQLEPDDLIELRALCREHHDRHARFGPDDPADLDAGELGQHEVQEDQVGPVPPEARERFSAVGRLDHPESLRIECVRERLAERRLVLDDEDRSCHSPPRIRSRVNSRLAAAIARLAAPPSSSPEGACVDDSAASVARSLAASTRSGI